MIPVMYCYAKTSHCPDNLPSNRSCSSAGHVHSSWHPVSGSLPPVHCARSSSTACVCSICSLVFSWCCCNCSRSTFFIASSFSLQYPFLVKMMPLLLPAVFFLLLSVQSLVADFERMYQPPPLSFPHQTGCVVSAGIRCEVNPMPFVFHPAHFFSHPLHCCNCSNCSFNPVNAFSSSSTC